MTDWRYKGGKNGAGVYQTIINRIPVHSHYIEPFAGSAAIFRRKAPAASSLLVERDPEQAKKLAMLASASTTVVCGDGVPALETAMGDGVFIYLDPPYLHATRKDLSLYRFEWSETQHRHLVESLLPALTDRGVRWMLSGYRHAIYDDAGLKHGWHSHDFKAMTRRGPATETIWMNYDPDACSIAESTFSGRDFRDRERVKRKAERWAIKFRQLPRYEQLAILDKIGGDRSPSNPPMEYCR